MKLLSCDSLTPTTHKPVNVLPPPGFHGEARDVPRTPSSRSHSSKTSSTEPSSKKEGSEFEIGTASANGTSNCPPNFFCPITQEVPNPIHVITFI